MRKNKTYKYKSKKNKSKNNGSKITKKNKRKNNGSKITKKVYSSDDFNSNDGMLTTVWGPSLWHTLHCISFNYPVNPSTSVKKKYKRFILCLKNVLPCGKCRKNLPKNLKQVPLNAHALKNRDNFSKWMYNLHEQINKMLNKKSNLTYEQVRERYEHFRARCSQDLLTKTNLMITRKKTRKVNKEKGCTEPLFGEKSKCIIKIVPKKEKSPTFQMDDKCIKKRQR